MKLSPQQNGVESDEPTCPDYGQFVLVPTHPAFGNAKKDGGFPDAE